MGKKQIRENFRNAVFERDTENGCHMKAELYHISEHEEWIEGFHPLDLFELIGSNEVLAIKKSEQL